MWDLYPRQLCARIEAVSDANLGDFVILKEVEEVVIAYNCCMILSRCFRRSGDYGVVVLRDFPWLRVDVEDRVVDFSEVVAE